MQIIHGDNVAVLKTFADESIDLTVTSPPYDDLRDYDGKPAFDLTALSRELLRVTVPGGWAALVMQDGTKNFAKSTTTFRTAIAWVDAGWKLFECCIYQRHGRPGAWWNRRFRVDHEYVLLFFKGDRPRCFDKTHLAVPTTSTGRIFHGTDRQTNGTLKRVTGSRTVKPTKCRGTVWAYAPRTEHNKLNAEHPATFPDQLAADLILALSRPGDVVLDPFAGSGTTIAMAQQHGRKGIGIDVSAQYVDLARRRLGIDSTAA